MGRRGRTAEEFEGALIGAESQKLDALMAHKKGLMQQLFPRESETLPRLRFPEFHSAPEWKSDTIGEIFDTTSGGTPSRSERTYWDGNIPWVTTSLVDFRVITTADEHITNEGLANLSAKLFPKGSIQAYLGRYTDLDFDIDYTKWTISFSKDEAEHIKVSRGEENIFVWCLFMALCERVIDGHPSYGWVKYLYIDDPISSLDDNNAIAVASDLAKLLRKAKDRTKGPKPEGKHIAPIKVVISSHHALFFNVVCNELKTAKCKRYFLHRPSGTAEFTVRAADDTPFFHHVAMLTELRKAADSGALYTYHFNLLRSILEKTATFFGKRDFSACLEGVEDQALYSRALNLLSHGKYSLYEPVEMLEDNKQLFRDILAAFLSKHAFSLPELLNEVPANAPAPTAVAQA